MIDIKTGVFITIIAILFGVVLFGDRSFNEKIRKELSTIDSLNIELKHQERQANVLRDSVEVLRTERDSAIAEAESYDSEIDRLDNELEELQDSVITLSAPEYQEWFDTKYPSNDTKLVLLDTIQASEVVSDVLEGEVAKQEVKVLKAQNLALKGVIQKGNTLLDKKDELNKQLGDILEIQQLKINEQARLINKQFKEINKQKFLTKFTGGSGVVAIIALLILL